MAKVTCKYCKNKIDKDKSHSIEYLTSSLSVRYKYYCNEDCCKAEENKKQDKIRLKELEVKARELTRDILELNSDKNIYFSKMYKDLRETYTDKVIYDYLTSEKMSIELVLSSKDFKTINAKIKYFFAMAQSKIDYYKNENNETNNVINTEKELNIDDFDITDKKKNSSRSIESLLDDLL